MGKRVLTLSVMTQGKKDTLKKTLESVKPLLDNVDSELIVTITDEGCGDEVKKLIESYTDKVIYFQWCNDFAKARNESFKAADGEWFLYLDDDEWFENVSELISFFKDDSRHDYDLLEYVQRNYHDYDGRTYTDSVVTRAAKITEDQMFVDAIHEHFAVCNKIKSVTSYVHHYGYVFANENEKLAHIERNLTLLKEQMQKKPYDCRTYAHMLQEYYGLDDYESMAAVAKRALDMADYFNIGNYRYIGVFYSMYIKSLIELRDVSKALYYADFTESLEYISGMARASIYYELIMMAEKQPGLINDIKVVSYVNRYLAWKKHYNMDEASKLGDTTIYVRHAFDDVCVENVMRAGMRLAAKYGGNV